MAGCRASMRTTRETKYPREISCAKVRPCRASDEPAAPPVRTCTSRSAARTSRATRSSIYHPGRVTNGNKGNQGNKGARGHESQVRLRCEPARYKRVRVRDLKELIRDIPDFPKPGILFRDITPLLLDAPAFRETVER